MQVFINEKSLHGQFTLHNIENGIRSFINTLQTINNCQQNAQVFSTQYFFDFNAVANVHLDSILNTQGELKNIFFQNIRNALKWEDQRSHNSTSSYSFNNINYVNSSVAELAERKIQNAELNGVLLNFKLSIFNGLAYIDVIKDGTKTVTVDCTEDEDSIISWLIRYGYINPNQVYNTNSRICPADYQTVLKDANLFQNSGLRNQGRKVFLRVGTDELWVVDNQHYGNDAHIEVFHRVTGEHLGTSPIGSVNLETRYKVPGRLLTL